MKACHALVALWLCGCARDAPSPPKSCRDNSACGADLLCVFAPGLCGHGPKAGHCEPRAQCKHEGPPVCGCDGRVHDDACAARNAGADLDVTGRCVAGVERHAACGAYYCDADASYCEIYMSDVYELPGRRRCRPLPQTCRTQPADCSCFPADTPCLSFCGPMVTGGTGGKLAFHLTCQGKHEPAD